MPLIDTPKNPVKVRVGTLGARKRWGPPRIARLDELTPEQRDVVLALIEAHKAANRTVAVDATPAGSEQPTPARGR